MIYYDIAFYFVILYCSTDQAPLGDIARVSSCFLFLLADSNYVHPLTLGGAPIMVMVNEIDLIGRSGVWYRSFYLFLFLLASALRAPASAARLWTVNTFTESCYTMCGNQMLFILPLGRPYSSYLLFSF